MAILQVKHLSKKFGSTLVLKDISFDLEKGQTLSLIGPSGSGKTTLLRILVSLETPSGGIISVAGKTVFDENSAQKLTPAQERENRLHFGMVFQNFNLFPQYTALENITLARKLNNPAEDRHEIDRLGMSLLDAVGLSDRASHYPHQLSGGQQQRVAIARALALEPDILCFDEPTSALDPELTGEVLRVIRGLALKHTTMIIVTHEMSFARDVSDKVIFMDKGVIVEEGCPKDLFGNPRQERTRQFLSRYTMDQNAP